MRTYWVRARLPPWLASELNRTAKRLGWPASRLGEGLLGVSGPYRDEILQGVVDGPFPEARTFRLRPRAMTRLMQLTEYTEIRAGDFGFGIRPSYFIRLMLAFFLSDPTRGVARLMSDPANVLIVVEGTGRHVPFVCAPCLWCGRRFISNPRSAERPWALNPVRSRPMRMSRSGKWIYSHRHQIVVREDAR